MSFPLDADDLAMLQVLLAVDRAKLFQGQEKALLSDGEIKIFWPELDPDYHTRAVYYLQNLDESVTDLEIDGQLHEGTWRNAFVEIQPDRDGTPQVVQTRRLGFATMLHDEEARIVFDQELQDMEELVNIQWRNLSPNNAHALREALTARDLAAGSSPPTVPLPAGIGSLLIRLDTFGADYEIASTNLTWEDDGSAVIDLFLVKTAGVDIDFTIGMSCSQEMLLSYSYRVPLDEMHTWKQSKGIHTRETGKKKDFRILRRDAELGTFDGVASTTTFIERSLSEFISEISAGGTMYQSSVNDASTIANVVQKDGEIIRVSGRKNDQCLIDYTVSRDVPADLLRESANKMAKTSTTLEEHTEDGDLDVAALEATVPDVNERIRWFYVETKAGNHAWLLENTVFEMVSGDTSQLVAATSRTVTTRRRDPEKPADPAVPAVGWRVMLQRICNDMGSWDWEHVTDEAHKLDSGWIPRAGRLGTEYMRHIMNGTLAEVTAAIAESLDGEVVSASPRYNADKTMDVFIVRALAPNGGDVDVSKGMLITINYLNKKYEYYHVEILTTRFAYKAEDFCNRKLVTYPPVTGKVYQQTWGNEGHKTSVSSIGGGRYMCIWVGGNTVRAGS